jgi:hypothetical protein
MGAVREEKRFSLLPFDEQTDQYTRTPNIQLNSSAAEGGGDGGGERANGPAHDIACPSSKCFVVGISFRRELDVCLWNKVHELYGVGTMLENKFNNVIS